MVGFPPILLREKEREGQIGNPVTICPVNKQAMVPKISCSLGKGLKKRQRNNQFPSCLTAISILQKETLSPYVTSLYGSLPPLPLESGSRERKGIVRTAVVQKPRSLMTNISGGQFLRGNNRAGLGDKTPFQAGGRHPRLEFCFLVPGPGRQAAAAGGAIHILVSDARRAGRGAGPLTQHAHLQQRSVLDPGGTADLTFSARAGCARSGPVALRCLNRQLRKWAVGRVRHLIHHLAQQAGVM